MLLHVAERLLNDPEQEDLGFRRQRRLVARAGKLRPDVRLGFVRLEKGFQRRNQVHRLKIQRAQVEDHLPRLLDGHLELGLGVAQQLKTPRRVRKDELAAEVQLEVDPGQGLHQAVVDFAGDAAALSRDRGSGLLLVEPGEILELFHLPFDLGVRAHARLDQLPHELGAGAPDDGHPDPIEFEEGLLHLRVPGHIDDQAHLFGRHQIAEVPRHGNPVALGQAQARRLGIDFGDADDPDQRVRRQDRQQGRPSFARADDRHVRHGGNRCRLTGRGPPRDGATTG